MMVLMEEGTALSWRRLSWADGARLRAQGSGFRVDGSWLRGLACKVEGGWWMLHAAGLIHGMGEGAVAVVM